MFFEEGDRTTILVVGATGNLGRATTRQLLNEGHGVRAMVRDRGRAEDLRISGAEVVTGDLTDPASLADACKGMVRVFACARSILGRGPSAARKSTMSATARWWPPPARPTSSTSSTRR